MNNATIELITPVHIGSGKVIQGNAEYLHFSKEQALVIVDEKKVLEVIGVDQLPIWLNYIENPDASFLDYLRKRKPSIQSSDIAARVLDLKGNKRPIPANTLRAHIHTGMGIPYLPGSSIKGALRTVFFAEMMLNTHSEGIDTRLLKNPRKAHQFKDQQLSQYAFGKDPNHDWFRLLQVSDFHFNTTTHACFSETLNEQGEKNYELKDSVKQLIEYIPSGASTNGSIKLNTILQQRANDKRTFNGKGSTFSMQNLIAQVNTNTLRLINRELKFFDGSDFPQEGELFYEELQRISTLFSSLATNECILRVGFGTGYRTMTGDWLELLNDDQYYDLSDTIRGKKYDNYPLPKSRKIILGGIPLGFIKLTLNLN